MPQQLQLQTFVAAPLRPRTPPLAGGTAAVHGLWSGIGVTARFLGMFLPCFRVEAVWEPDAGVVAVQACSYLGPVHDGRRDLWFVPRRPPDCHNRAPPCSALFLLCLVTCHIFCSVAKGLA